MQIAIECSLIKRCVFIFSFVCTCSGSTDFIHTSNNCYLVPLLGEDSHFDYILLFNWVETTNQIQISFYHLSSRIHATHRSTVMWLHWFRLRGGQWLGPFFPLIRVSSRDVMWFQAISMKPRLVKCMCYIKRSYYWNEYINIFDPDMTCLLEVSRHQIEEESP